MRLTFGLVAKTKRIGAGDLSGDLVIRGRDELSDLARAMNSMCQHLAVARDEVRQKNEARLAALDQLRHSARLSMLGRLSSGLAHELGPPLNVVAGRAKISGFQSRCLPTKYCPNSPLFNHTKIVYKPQ